MKEDIKDDCRDTLLNLHQYIDGETEAKTSAIIEAHLSRCPSCKKEAECLKEIKRLIASAAAEPPAHLHSKIMQRIKEEKKRTMLTSLRRYLTVAAAALVVITAVPVMGVIFNNTKDSTQNVAGFSECASDEIHRAFGFYDTPGEEIGSDVSSGEETKCATAAADKNSPTANYEETVCQSTDGSGETENADSVVIPPSETAPETKATEDCLGRFEATGYGLGEGALNAILEKHTPFYTSDKGLYMFAYSEELLAQIREQSISYLTFDSETEAKLNTAASENNLDCVIVIVLE